MIETTILNISKTIGMSSGENLLGFQIDCEHLIQHDYFIGTEISVSADPLNMIEINITINEQFHTLQELANTVRALYSHIEYQSFSCYRMRFTPDVLIQRFITVINGDKFYVSGTITVQGDQYQTLYKKHLKDFPID